MQQSNAARNDTPDQPTEMTAEKVVRLESGEDGVFDQLEDIAARPPRTWTARALPQDADPNEWVVSESVVGVVEYLDGRTSDFGAYVMAEIRTKAGDRLQVHLFGTVLKKWGPVLRIGDGVAIHYRGTKPSSVAGQADFADYEVLVVRGGKRVSAAHVLGENDEPAEGADEEGSDGVLAL
jgi:hypothetical protein